MGLHQKRDTVKRAGTSVLVLSALIGLSACGVGDLDSETTKALAAQQARNAPSPAPVQTPTAAPTAAPSPAATPTAAPSPAPNPTPSAAPTPAATPTAAPTPTASIAAGKATYENNCVFCHGADISKNGSNITRGAGSPTTIMNALSKVPNMRYLQATIQTKDAQDIAAYLQDALK
jgi:mono/diheme cytochrome c family protein